MASVGFTYWKDGDMRLGYLEQFPDYMTQGDSLQDLKKHLLDLYKDLSSGVVPNVRHRAPRGRRTLPLLLLPQICCYRSKLLKRRFQVLHDRGRDDVGSEKIGAVFEALVFEPEDVEG